MTLRVQLCDLRRRFLAKGRAGRGYRAIARNGRVLLASSQTLAELADRIARVRLQTWHRFILPGEPPEAYGVLLYVQPLLVGEPEFVTRLAREADGPFELRLDVGGGSALEFRRLK